MKHFKNYLDKNNNYEVQITFIVDENNKYLVGKTNGHETDDELEMMYVNLKNMGLTKKYDKPTHISFVDGGTDDNGQPLVDLYFKYFDDVKWCIDKEWLPVKTVTREFIDKLLF